MLTPFIVWRLRASIDEQQAEIENVASRLLHFLRIFVAGPVRLQSGRVGRMGYIVAEREVENLGWSRTYQTPRADYFCLKIPCNVLRFGWEAISETLFKAPGELLTKLTFGYLFLKVSKDCISLQADSLGGTGCSIVEQDGIVAVTSHLFLLRTLELQLEIDWHEILIRVGLNALTSEKSGFNNVRRFLPGERLDLSSDGEVKSTRFDVIGDVFQAPELSASEALKLFRDEFYSDVSKALLLFRNQPQLELSGGWDSRALASVLSDQGVSFGARTYGRFYVPDLILAKRVARMLNIRLEIDSATEYGEARYFLASVEKTNAWSQGYSGFDVQKVMFNNRNLGRPSLLLDGLGGELTRAFTQRFPLTLSKDALRRQFLEYKLKKIPAFFTAEMRASCKERLDEVIEQSFRYSSCCQILGHLMLMLNRKRERVFVDFQNNLKLSPFYSPLHLKLSLSTGFSESRPADVFPRSLISRPELLRLPHSKLQFVNQLYWNIRHEDLQFYDERAVWKSASNDETAAALRSREAFQIFSMGDPKRILRREPDSFAALLFADSVVNSSLF